jgi:arsenate reductase-like glutaredoxin family protein
MSEAEALKLLSKNGKLIKRPFLLTKNGGTVGFKPKVWDELI